MTVGDLVTVQGERWVVVADGDPVLCLRALPKQYTPFRVTGLEFKERMSSRELNVEVSNLWEGSILQKNMEEQETTLTRKQYEKVKDRIPQLGCPWWLRTPGKARTDVCAVFPDGSVEEIAANSWDIASRPARYFSQSDLSVVSSPVKNPVRCKESGKVCWAGGRHWVILGEYGDEYFCILLDCFGSTSCLYDPHNEVRDGWTASPIRKVLNGLFKTEQVCSETEREGYNGVKYRCGDYLFLLTKEMWEQWQDYVPPLQNDWWLGTRKFSQYNETYCISGKELQLTADWKTACIRPACFFQKQDVRLGWNMHLIREDRNGAFYILDDILCAEINNKNNVPVNQVWMNSIPYLSLQAFGQAWMPRGSKVFNLTVDWYHESLDVFGNIPYTWWLTDIDWRGNKVIKSCVCPEKGRGLNGFRPIIFVPDRERKQLFLIGSD